jgi:hypothetical protein
MRQTVLGVVRGCVCTRLRGLPCHDGKTRSKICSVALFKCMHMICAKSLSIAHAYYSMQSCFILRIRMIYAKSLSIAHAYLFDAKSLLIAHACF